MKTSHNTPKTVNPNFYVFAVLGFFTVLAVTLVLTGVATLY